MIQMKDQKIIIIKEIKIEKKIESRRFRNYYCQG